MGLGSHCEGEFHMALFRGNLITWVLMAVEVVLLFILTNQSSTNGPNTLSVLGAVIALVVPSVIGFFAGGWQAAVTYAVAPYWLITLVYYLMDKSPTPVVVGSSQDATGLAFGLILYSVLGWLGHQAGGALALGPKPSSSMQRR
jgi:hypothetical protein